MTAATNSHRSPGPRRDGRMPVVSLGQGVFRRDYFPKDRGVNAASNKSVQPPAASKLLEADVIGAALRYVAVADWFEQLPLSRHEPDRERRAMDLFNRIEAELRRAGGRLLRRLGHRQLVLEGALKEVPVS